MTRGHRKTPGAYILLGFAVTALLFPVTTYAACCLCTGPSSPTDKICIKTEKTCSALKTEGTAAVKALNCTESLPDDDARCRPIDKGVCTQGPVDEKAYTPGAKGATTTSVTVPGGLTLGVPIPGLDFSSTLSKQGDTLYVPYFAQYISAIQKYALGITVTAAAVMIVYGGFLYILSSSGATVSSGKEKILDAVVGLVLVLGSVTILTTINPSTVQPKVLEIKGIKPRIQRLNTETAQAMGALAGTEFTPDPETVAALKSIKGTKPPPTRMRPDDPFDTREVLDAGEINQVAEYIGKKTGIEDRCIIKAMMGIESGNAINAIGHDEDAPIAGVQSRLDFLRSGKKWSAEEFTPPSDLPELCSAGNMNVCTSVVKSSAWYKFYNDDSRITATPPDFGLDWRFSHGIGLTQLTIFPNRGCKGKNGAWGLKHPATGTTCWTTPVLLTLEGTIDLTIAAMKTMRENGAVQPCDFFNGWAGKAKGGCIELVQNKQEAYAKCKK